MQKLKDLYIKYEEVINYLIVGVLTTVVSLATYYLCVYTFLNPKVASELQLANIISWVVSVTFAYFTNRKYVFKSQTKNIKKEASSFYASRIITLLMDMGIMFLFVTILHLNDKLFKIVSQIIVIIANYIISKFFVFKKDKSN